MDIKIYAKHTALHTYNEKARDGGRKNDAQIRQKPMHVIYTNMHRVMRISRPHFWSDSRMYGDGSATHGQREGRQVKGGGPRGHHWDKSGEIAGKRERQGKE